MVQQEWLALCFKAGPVKTLLLLGYSYPFYVLDQSFPSEHGRVKQQHSFVQYNMPRGRVRIFFLLSTIHIVHRKMYRAKNVNWTFFQLWLYYR